MMHSISLVLLTFTIAVSLAGCDPVRSVQQTVNFKVADDEGNPISGIRVELKENFNSNTTSHNLEKQRLEFWERLPWKASISNENGEATVNIENTMIDRSSRDTPVAGSSVAGRRYQLRLDGGDSVEIELKDNSTVTINGTSVSLVKVLEPHYIQTQN